MDKALEHVGIYDFWGIFWAGIINLATWIIVFAITTSSFEWIISTISNNIWLFLFMYIVLGYFVGSLLHEIGRFFRDKMRLFGKNAIYFYLSSDNINEYIKKEFIDVIKKDLPNIDMDFNSLGTTECQFLYDYCNTYLKRYNLNLRSDKTQSIYGFSRGLFSGYALFSIIYPIILLVFHKPFNFQAVIILVISIISALLFHNRTRIYDNNRVKNIITMYYIDKKTRAN